MSVVRHCESFRGANFETVFSLDISLALLDMDFFVYVKTMGEWG